MRWPIIDTHNHIGARPDCTYLGDELIETMDACGQDMALVFQMNENREDRTPEDNPYIGHDYIAKVQAKYPDRLIGLATINPWYQGSLVNNWGRSSGSLVKTRNRAVEEVERCMTDLKLNGIKFHPMLGGFHVNDPVIMPPVMDKLLELQNRQNRRLVVAVHTLADSVFNTPEAVGGLAAKYPELTVIMVHAGAVWGYPTVMEIVKSNPNILLDFTWVPAVGTVKEAIRTVGVDRMCAGADSPFSTYKMKHTLIEEATEDPEEREIILGGTIAKLFNIPKILD